MRLTALGCCVAVACIAGAGCRRTAQDAEQVVVYCSVDEAFAREVLDVFEQQTGIRVVAQFDSEAGKTTGLVKRLELEAGAPRADVFWSSEPFNTLVLARGGVLEAYRPAGIDDTPERYRDPAGLWTAIAVRARVLAYDPARVTEDDLPKFWEELARPELARRTAFANPLFGTTRGHVAAMFALWGEERGRAFLTGLREGGALMVDGNSAAVRAVLDGRADFAMTDTDDVYVANRGGASLNMLYLDMGDGGTLLVPCSVAVVRGAPNPATGRKLADFLCSAEVERMLARSASGNVPVREAVRVELGMELPPGTSLPFERIAAMIEPSAEAVREILLR